MKTNYPPSIVRAVALAALGFLLPHASQGWGAEPPPLPRGVVEGAVPVAAQGASRGKILVLENENLIEGDIERVGTQYRVRRRLGETWVPAASVLTLCGSVEEAYGHVRSRSNPNDPDEHLKLARWCHQWGLRRQALREVELAVQLRPGHGPSQRLLGYLRQSQDSQPAAAPPAAPEVVSAAFAIDLTAEALGQFTTRVQPILMNACASCHLPTAAGGRDSGFRLQRTHGSGFHQRKTTQANLAAVLAHMNVDQPLHSLFLTKALSVHGGMAQAPFRNRDAPAYRSLESWVRQTVATNPQLAGTIRAAAVGTPGKDVVVPAVVAPPPSDAGPPPPPAAAAAEKGFAAEAPPADQAGLPSPAPPTARPAPPATVAPLDPFDAEHFNRQMHPDQPARPPSAPTSPPPPGR